MTAGLRLLHGWTFSRPDQYSFDLLEGEGNDRKKLKVSLLIQGEMIVDVNVVDVKSIQLQPNREQLASMLELVKSDSIFI